MISSENRWRTKRAVRTALFSLLTYQCHATITGISASLLAAFEAAS